MEALHVLRREARFQRRCLDARLYVEEEDPDALFYLESWSSEEDLPAQLLSEHFTRLLALMETATEPPDLRFHFVERTEGLEYAEKARCSSRE